jgi:hypothetical protein
MKCKLIVKDFMKFRLTGFIWEDCVKDCKYNLVKNYYVISFK